MKTSIFNMLRTFEKWHDTCPNTGVQCFTKSKPEKINGARHKKNILKLCSWELFVLLYLAKQWNYRQQTKLKVALVLSLSLHVIVTLQSWNDVVSSPYCSAHEGRTVKQWAPWWRRWQIPPLGCRVHKPHEPSLKESRKNNITALLSAHCPY